MNKFNCVASVAVAMAGFCLATASPRAHAQISINIGAPPACPYGYYDYAPYNCAPYGYYGPMWFINGLFIGAGPWFRGPANFHGYVDNHFDPRHGYHGPMPRRGARPDRRHRPGAVPRFRGNEMHNGHGQERSGGRGQERGRR